MSVAAANRRLRVAILAAFGAALVLAVGCPPAPKPKPRPKVDQPPPSYPYRGKTIRVGGQLHIFSHTKTRDLAVLYQPASGGLVKPVALVGVDARRGSVRWTKSLPLKLRNPELPWSFEIARNVTYLAAWVKGSKIRAIDIYGRDAWESKLTGVLGVSRLGVGFVTAKGSKIYYLDRKTGKASPVVDVGAPITAPLEVMEEGEVIALTGDFLIGVNVDAPEGKKVIFRHRLQQPEGMLPTKPQVKAGTIVVGSKAVPLVIKTEVSRLDPNTLKPKWKKLLPGRIRSHDSLFTVGDEIRLINRVPGRDDHLYVLSGADGQVTSKIKAGVRPGCQYGTKQLYCVTKQAVVGYDRRTLREAWKREMLDDVTGSQHLAHGSTFYIAEGAKVVGVDTTGRVDFSFEIKAPPYRPQVNRILGVVKNTLIITVVDWIRQRGTAQVWGIDLATSKRKWKVAWNMLTATPKYSENAVQLVGDRILLADQVWVRAYAANSGRLLGGVPHRLRAPKAKVPAVKTAGDMAWLEREGTLALLFPKNGRVRWRAKLGDARVVAVGQTLIFVKAPSGEIRALDIKKGGKVRWKIQYQATLRPKIVEVPGGVLISHHSHALVLDPATGKTKETWKPGGWHLRMMGETPLLVRVLTFQPKQAGLLEAVKYNRDRKKAERAWLFEIPLPTKPVKTLASAVKGSFPWFHVAADLVLFPYQGGRCLAGIDIVDGKQRWKQCKIAWIAPPRAFRGRLYAATGRYLEGIPAERQGLFAVSEEDGSVLQLFKVPRSGDERYMLPQYGPCTDGEFFVLTQGERLRQLFLAAPLKRRRR